jgi:hypothetical protein
MRATTTAEHLLYKPVWIDRICLEKQVSLGWMLLRLVRSSSMGMGSDKQDEHSYLYNQFQPGVAPARPSPRELQLRFRLPRLRLCFNSPSKLRVLGRTQPRSPLGDSKHPPVPLNVLLVSALHSGRRFVRPPFRHSRPR